MSLRENDDSDAWKQRLVPNRDAFIFDTYLFAISEKTGIAVWDINTGTRMHHDPTFSPLRYHPRTKEFLTRLPDGTFQVSRLVE